MRCRALWITLVTLPIITLTLMASITIAGEREVAAVQDPLDVLDGRNVLHPMLERYSTDRNALRRTYPIPMSDFVDERMKSFFADWSYRLDTVDFDALPHAGKVDYILFRNLLNHESKALAHEMKRNAEIAELVPFRETITSLAEAARLMEPVDGRKAAEALNAINDMIEALTTSIGDEELTATKIIADRAVKRIGDLRRSLGGWHHFYNGYDPMFTWWTKQPFGKVDAALDAYATLVRKKLVGVDMDDEETIIGDPIGTEALADELAFEMIPYSPQELIAIAEKQFAWCQAERLKA